jgi:hypothetical protein
MNDDNFDRIEDYFEGNLDKEEQLSFLQKLRDDDAFYKDFQLWTNLDEWLEELPSIEIRQILVPKTEEKPIFTLIKTPKIVWSIACSIMLLLGFGWYKLSQNKSLKEQNGQLEFAVINLPDNGGKGFGGGGEGKLVYEKTAFKVAENAQKDTTYTFANKPLNLVVRVPKIEDKMEINWKLLYDYKNKEFQLFIRDKKFIIKETTKWTKLNTPVQ